MMLDYTRLFSRFCGTQKVRQKIKMEDLVNMTIVTNGMLTPNYPISSITIHRSIDDGINEPQFFRERVLLSLLHGFKHRTEHRSLRKSRK